MPTLITILIILAAFLGVPLYLIIGGAAVFGYFLADEFISSIFIEVYKIATNPVLMAIPLFTFAGYMMAESNTPKRLINLSRAIIGWLPGGLSIVAIITCALFTAFTGASGVTIVAMGGLLLPILIKEGYSKKFSTGLLTTNGSLGLLFPPSLPLILYAVIAGSSYSAFSNKIEITVDKLFLASAIPGIILVVVLSLYGILKAKKNNISKTKFSFKELIKATKQAKWEIPLPIFILWGIYGGIFTASEASAITALYVFIIEVFIYKDIKLNKLTKVIKESSILVGGIIIIIGMALSFTSYLVEQEVPQQIIALMKTYITNKYSFLIVLNIFLLIVGCIMDIFSAILVVVPLIIPISYEFGINPLHLGVIFLTNLEIGYSTPPVGLNLFIASFRFKQPIVHLYKASIPYLLILLSCLILFTYFPEISLFLTR